MQSATMISVSEYLSTTYEPDREYVDGEVVERNLGEKNHSRLQALITGYFLAREDKLGTIVLTEQRVQVSATRFRVPDVCLILADAPDEEIIVHAPVLCIEILSKDDLMSRTHEKIADYLTMGVPDVWVIDPRTRCGYRYTSEGMREAQDGVMRCSNADLLLPLSELFG